MRSSSSSRRAPTRNTRERARASRGSARALAAVLAGLACNSGDASSTADASATTRDPASTGPATDAPATDDPETVADTDTDTGAVDGFAPADCAQASLDEAALARWPYVQRVSATAATVAWGIADDERPAPAQLHMGRDDAYGLVADASAQVIPALPQGGGLRLYAATLEGLTPATEYCYQLVVDGAPLASGLRFHTAPAGDDAVVRFAVVGDFGTGSDAQRQILAQIVAVHERDGLDLLLTTGDNAYGAGTHQEWQENVFAIYQPLLTGVPMFPVIGNHDDKTDEAQPYLDSLFLPEQALREQDHERYYSIDWGPLHFVALDTERALDDMTPGLLLPELDEPDEQDDWFRQDMEAQGRPWRIVSFHQPAFSNTEGRSPEQRMRQEFVPMFEEFGVQLVVQGHNHLYERYHAIKGTTLTTTMGGGVTYLVTGGGGQSLYEEDSYEDPYQVTFAEKHNFVYGVIDGCTMTLTAIDEAGLEFDATVLERC
ncbi:MAG: metallophosphoesterase family protein [Myxococcales bacterium]|nr:metallophosphoesterase family protein [Myxococcales bacterium]